MYLLAQLLVISTVWCEKTDWQQKNLNCLKNNSKFITITKEFRQSLMCRSYVQMRKPNMVDLGKSN